MNWLNNILCLTDSYKVSHHKQYPPKTHYTRSYFESRSGAKFEKTTFFGLHYFLKNYLEGRVVTEQKIAEAKELFSEHFSNSPFNEEGWKKVIKYRSGYLPIRIRAVPEGFRVSESNVLMTVQNTDQNFAWLTNYVESLITQVWYPSTVASLGSEMRSILYDYAARTCDNIAVDYQMHDFGFRGVTCPEQAALGGAAHLVNFNGTDNLAGLIMARKFYGAFNAGNSIPASEHSTITSWGEANECEAMRNMLEQFPTGAVACVSDSFDIYRACSEFWGEKLRNLVLSRDGVVVIRPDSGNPLVVLREVLRILGEKFGYEVNRKGFKVLNPKVRVIQGDGIDLQTMKDILWQNQIDGWASENVFFGSGGGLLQKMNRDTQRFAFKCSSIQVDGEVRDVYKHPITSSSKNSKRGCFKLVASGKGYVTVPESEPGQDVLVTVFENGHVVRPFTFHEIKERARS